MTTHHLNPNQRAALRRGRELHEGRQAEQRALAEQKRKNMKSMRKTSVGDRVARFPKTSVLLDSIEGLREELTDLYDTAATMRDRAAQMEREAKPNSSRFTVLEG